MFATYSFEDVIASFKHSGVGTISSSGAGLGSIAVSMANDKTIHDVAADGNVMISKILGKNGTLSLTIQQTSALHKWLLKWYKYVNTAAPAQWAAMSVTISSKNLGDNTVLTGVSPQKLADRAYQSQGQMVTWNLMAAEITQS